MYSTECKHVQKKLSTFSRCTARKLQTVVKCVTRKTPIFILQTCRKTLIYCLLVCRKKLRATLQYFLFLDPVDKGDVWRVCVCMCGKVQLCAHTISVHMEYNINVHMENDIYMYVNLDYNIYTCVHTEYNVGALYCVAYVHVVSIMCTWGAVMCRWNGITSANTQIQKCVMSNDLTSVRILGSDS